MLNGRAKRLIVSLGMSLAIVSLAAGCSKLKKPEETESETATEKETEPVTEKETESETEEQTELKLDIAYTSQDKSIRITLPDSTWKVTQDADEMRVFSSGSAAMINIVHAANAAQMKNISVAESEEVLRESLTRQYPSANAFEVVSFEQKTAGTITACEYVVKYNATSMWAYSITYGILTPNEAYVIQGTVTDDNKVLLDAVQKAVESFTVLNNSPFGTINGGVQAQSETQSQTGGAQNAEAELKTLTDYGTTATLYARDHVNIRNSPTTSDSQNIIGSLTPGAQVTVVGETSQWFKVNINGNIGYISKAFLVNQPVAETEPPSESAVNGQDTPVSDSTKTTAELNSQIDYGSASVMYTTTEVNVRAQPGTESGLVDVFGSGQSVQVIGETDNWFKVSVNGAVGYISKSYISYSDPGTSGGGTDGNSGGGTDGNSGGGTDGNTDGDSSNNSGTGTITGTIKSASMSGIVIAGDDGQTYSINTTDASVDTHDGIYDGLYVSVTVDYSNTTPSGELYATSVTGY